MLKNIALFFIFLLLAWIVRPIPFNSIQSEFLGGTLGDPGLYQWLARVALPNILGGHWFDLPAFYPYGQTLAWSDNFILPSTLFWFLKGLGASEPLAWNIIIIIAIALNGFTAYKLAFRILDDKISPLIVGVTFTSYSFLAEHLGHIQLQFAFFIPLTLLLLIDFYRKESFILALVLGFNFLAAFLTTVYYAAFSLLLIFLFCLATFLSEEKKPLLRKFIYQGIGFALPNLFLIPFILPYFNIKETFGGRELYEAFYFSASPLSFFSFGNSNLLYSFTSPWSHSEAHLAAGGVVLLFCWVTVFFIGTKSRNIFFWLALLGHSSGLGAIFIIPTQTGRMIGALALWSSIIFGFLALAYEHKNKFLDDKGERLVLIFYVLTLTLCALSLGPLGNPEKGQLALGPYVLFSKIIPGLEGIRAIGRLGVVWALCISILSAWGAKRVLSDKKFKIPATALLSTIIVIENLNFPIGHGPERPPPQITEKLPTEGTTLIVLPWTSERHARIESWSGFAKSQVQAMNWFALTPNIIVNGYSGMRSKLMTDLAEATRKFPDNRSLNILSTLVGLEKIIYLPEINGDLHFSSTKVSETLGNNGERIFQLIGPFPVDENRPLLLPARANRLVLELSSSGQNPSLASFWDVSENERIGPLLETSINQEWKAIDVSLKPPKNMVRPRRIAIVGNDLLFRKTKWYE